MTTTPRDAASAATGSTTGGVRLHGLDALRAGALLLGILLHSLMPFAISVPWLVVDRSTAVAPLLIIAVIHLFRMVTFMLLAGWFGAMLVTRRGPRSYLVDRLKRVGLPLVAFWPIAVLPLGILAAIFAERTGTVAELPADAPPMILLILSPGHLWFLLVLVECVLIVLGGRWLLRATLGVERTGAVAATVGGWLSAPGGVLIAAVPYLATLLLQGTTFGGIVAPPTVLPSAALVAYLGAFVVGWSLFARPGALDRIAYQWAPHLILALLLTVGVLLLPETTIGLPAAAAVNALAGLTWAYALLGICVRFLQAERPAVRYLADASYWMYLLHLPLLVGFQLLIFDQPWPMLIKLGLTWLVVGAVLLGSYQLLVRHTWLGGWLNGRRVPRSPASRGLLSSRRPR